MSSSFPPIYASSSPPTCLRRPHRHPGQTQMLQATLYPVTRSAMSDLPIAHVKGPLTTGRNYPRRSGPVFQLGDRDPRTILHICCRHTELCPFRRFGDPGPSDSSVDPSLRSRSSGRRRVRARSRHFKGDNHPFTASLTVFLTSNQLHRKAYNPLNRFLLPPQTDSTELLRRDR